MIDRMKAITAAVLVLMSMTSMTSQAQSSARDAYIQKYGNPALYKRMKTDPTVRRQAIHAYATILAVDYLDHRGIDDLNRETLRWLASQLGPFSVDDEKWLQYALDANEIQKAQQQSFPILQEVSKRRVQETIDAERARRSR
jgi:hypothetical protein